MKTNRKKLSLNVDELNVATFATADSLVERGTVHGRDNTDGCSARGECTKSCDGDMLCPLTYPLTACAC
jgi:hypothetical protein